MGLMKTRLNDVNILRVTLRGVSVRYECLYCDSKFKSAEGIVRHALIDHGAKALWIETTDLKPLDI